MFIIGITDHLESPLDRSSAELYAEVSEMVRLADAVGMRYAWFAEHHAHAHRGHLPAPLLLALHLAGVTRQIRLGTAVICLNLHAPLETAEHVAVADLLMDRRLAPGFGSGSTPAEAAWLGIQDAPDETRRHQRFESALNVIRAAWDEPRPPASGKFLPEPASDLRQRTWIAVNSIGAAGIAGRFGGHVLLSHLRTPLQHNQYVDAYRAAGGNGLIALNRPVYVDADDETAFAAAESALRTLWRRFRDEGKIAVSTPEPADVRDLCQHPLNFIVGGVSSVLRQLRDLQALCPFDVLNVELRWDGLTHAQVLRSLERLMSCQRNFEAAAASCESDRHCPEVAPQQRAIRS